MDLTTLDHLRLEGYGLSLFPHLNLAVPYRAAHLPYILCRALTPPGQYPLNTGPE